MISLKQSEFAEAIVFKLAPKAEKKFPSMSNSSQEKFLDKYTEMTLANITNSFPEQL